MKFSADYNLKKFLKEKERIREKNKTNVLAESDSIVERIVGESSSNGSRIPIMSKINGSSQSYGGVKRQNFMATERDPNSIINIMIQRQMPAKP